MNFIEDTLVRNPPQYESIINIIACVRGSWLS